MSERAIPQLPLPSETSHITRRRPSQPTPITTEQPQQTLHQHTCNSPNCAAAKVLSTPELLENTLTHLPTKDVLSLRHVSKTWQSLITTSPSLRLHLFLEPQWHRPATEFKLLPCTTIPGLQIVRGEPVHLGQWIKATMTPAAARSTSRKIYKRPAPKKHRCGAAYRRIPSPVEEVEDSDDEDHQQQQNRPYSSSSSSSSLSLTPQQTADLLLTQPPLVGVQASVVLVKQSQRQDDSESSNIPVILKTSPSRTPAGTPTMPREGEEVFPDPSIPTPLASSKLACDAGITLGFMAEAVNFLLRDLEFLGGSGDSLGKQGQEVVVVFRAIVSFCARTDGAPRMRGGTRFVTKVE